jgi:hypothetical protein
VIGLLAMAAFFGAACLVVGVLGALIIRWVF